MRDDSDYRNELDAAHRRIEALEAANEELRAELEGRRSPPTPEEPKERVAKRQELHELRSQVFGFGRGLLPVLFLLVTLMGGVGAIAAFASVPEALPVIALSTLVFAVYAARTIRRGHQRDLRQRLGREQGRHHPRGTRHRVTRFAGMTNDLPMTHQ